MLTTAEKLTLWLFACIAGCWSEPRVQKSVHHRGACPCWPQFLAVAFRCAAFPSHTAVFLHCLLALKKGEKLGLAPNIAQAASDAARVSVCVCACVCVCVCVCAECCLLTAHTAPVANSPNPFISVHLCILAAVFAPQSVRAITSAPTPLQKTTAINHAMHVLLTSASAQHTAFAAAATTGAVNGDNHKPPSRTPMTADDLVPALCKRLCWVNKLCLHVPLCC